MAQIPYMNWMGDQPTGSAYDVYQYYLGGGGPGGTTPTSGGTGIMQAYQPTGDGGGGIGGNAFGYGTTVDPVSRGAYGQPGYSGGLPGNVTQKGLGRNMMADIDPNYDPNALKSKWMSSREYLTGKRKQLPGIASMALSAIPFGGLLRGKIEDRMNDPRLSQGYKVGGMDYGQKGLYDSLAGGNMLFEGPGGLKTLTGKNFMGKGYLEGQLELAKGFGFDEMSEEEIDEAIAKQQLNKKGQFKWKQMKESKAIYDKNKALDAWEAKEEKERKTRGTFTGDHPDAPTKTPEQGGWHPGVGGQPDNTSSTTSSTDYGGGWHPGVKEGGMITDLTKDPEYRGWKKMYETNPEIGSMHEKHPTFIKFYKKHERDRKKFGGLAGLLYG